MKESIIKEIGSLIEKYDLKFSFSKNFHTSDYIKKFINRIDWYRISQYQTLSEDFIREFQNKVNWYLISIQQNLSEKFIREFKNEVHWDMISKYQTLSELFIKEFKHKINLSTLFENGNIKISIT